MSHEITVKFGNSVQTIKATGGVFVVAYDSPADGEDNGGVTAVIRAHPKDLAEAMLGQDGLNGAMLRQFAESMCDALYAILRRTGKGQNA